MASCGPCVVLTHVGVGKGWRCLLSFLFLALFSLSRSLSFFRSLSLCVVFFGWFLPRSLARSLSLSLSPALSRSLRSPVPRSLPPSLALWPPGHHGELGHRQPGRAGGLAGIFSAQLEGRWGLESEPFAVFHALSS